MTFWCECEVLRKSWISEENAEAGNDFSKIKVVRLPADMNLLTLELRSTWHLFIDDAVKLLCGAVRNSQVFDHLSQYIVSHPISFTHNELFTPSMASSSVTAVEDGPLFFAH